MSPCSEERSALLGATPTCHDPAPGRHLESRCDCAPPLSPEERAVVERFEAAGDPYAEDDYPASWDRIYPRCPVCRSEQYALAVLDFSAGKHGCWRCHHVIREDARLRDGAA